MKAKSISLKSSLCGILLAALYAAPVWADEKTVATVNGVPLPQSQLDLLVGSFVAQGVQDGDELRRQLTEELAAREAIAQAASKLGLDKSPEVVAGLANARRDLLLAAFQADYLARHPVSEAEIKALYEQRKEAAGDKEYRVRHVLVKTEAEAKEVLAALKKGGKLEALAREKSLDSESRAAGGDIGWHVPTDLVVPVMRDLVRSLAKGQTSEQVQSPFGWHVLRVEDVRPFEFPSIDKVREALRQQLQRDSVQKAILEIRQKADIK